MGPYRGVVRALDWSGITYMPLHADDIATAAGRFGVLILPNVGAMSDAQVAAVQAFADAGGSVIATSETSSCSEFGDRRSDFALGSLFGVHPKGGSVGDEVAPDTNIETHARHTYLRLAPNCAAVSMARRTRRPQQKQGGVIPILAGLEAADTLPFGGYLPLVSVDGDVEVLATFIPDFPIYPPETSWMREPRTDLPAITVKEARFACQARLVRRRSRSLFRT